MKSYYDFMREITAEELYEGLLGYGMFNEKLPPFLTSKTFYHYCKANYPAFNNTNKVQSFIMYEHMRNINIPRAFGIPTPMAYQRLCITLKNNWDKIVEHFEKKTKNDCYKISRIHIRKMKDTKKIFKMNYNNFKKDGTPEPDLLIGSKYIVNADISTCFPSIYTHSLPWALVGKEEAKKNQRDHSKWYNELDLQVRNNTNGETQGILIGPHASNLLSEIILTSIDFELQLKGWKYIRNIDDYTCYVNNYEEGQKFLLDLSAQLRQYKLTLNHKKTKISSLPIASTENWIRKLNAYLKLTEKDTLNYKDIQACLDLSIELMFANNSNTAIINYTIKVLSNKNLTVNAINYYVKNIFHLTIIYPYLISLLEKYIFDVFQVNKKSIMDFSNTIYKEGIKSNNFELVSYSIYYAVVYEFEVKEIDFSSIRKSNHCILLLLSYMYCKENSLTSEIKKLKRLAREMLKDEEEFTHNWLFVYEILPKSSLKGDWKMLKENNISFLKKL